MFMKNSDPWRKHRHLKSNNNIRGFHQVVLYIQGSVSNVEKKEAELESRPAVLRKASQRLETHQVGLLSTFYATVVPPTPSELRDTVFFFQTP